MSKEEQYQDQRQHDFPEVYLRTKVQERLLKLRESAISISMICGPLSLRGAGRVKSGESAKLF